LSGFFAELKRRNVVKVGIAYMALGWIVIQVTDVAVPALNLPESLNSIVVYLGIIGMPFALFFAWAFELTPDGVMRTEDVDETQSITTQTSQKINYLIISFLVIIVLGLLYDRDSNSPTDAISDEDMPSIAVLAFADFSPSQDQEYFADGISDEILNLLVRTKGMTVTGRTSSFSFKGKDDDIPTIAQKLNVEHVLEGSISKSNNRIKITAQLNDANGVHLWSETYIRELTDIFDIQEEIAAEITQTLAASVGITINSAKVDRTNNIEAYDLYIKGKALFLKRGFDNLRLANLLFQQTLALDPDYAPAWRDLAAVYSVMESYAPNTPQEEIELWRTAGLASVQRAITLSPDDAESHSAKAAFHIYDFDMSEGMDEIIKAINLSPKNAHVLDLAAQSFLEIGYFKRAEELSLKAVEIDPLVSIYRVTLARTYYSQGRYEEGIEESKKAILLNNKLTFPYFHIISEAVSRKQIDLARNTLQQSIDADFIFPLTMEEFNVIEAFIENYQPGDAYPEELNPYMLWTVASAVQDYEKIAEIFNQIVSNKFRTNTALFERADEVYNSELWKQAVRELGIFNIWLTHGFPKHCRQVNNDDFECTPSLLLDNQ